MTSISTLDWQSIFIGTRAISSLPMHFFQALRKQFPDVDYEMKTLRRFKFGNSGQLEINFERKLAGGWQMALESSSKVRM